MKRAQLKLEASEIRRKVKIKQLSTYTKKQLKKRYSEISDLLCGFDTPLKKAIGFLKTIGIACDSNGVILSKLPDGIRGIELIDMLEENTIQDDYCFTIIANKLVSIPI